MEDGEAFASKYNNQQLKICVPNVVMVFSISPADIKEVAKVRLRVKNLKRFGIRDYDITTFDIVVT